MWYNLFKNCICVFLIFVVNYKVKNFRSHPRDCLECRPVLLCPSPVVNVIFNFVIHQHTQRPTHTRAASKGRPPALPSPLVGTAPLSQWQLFLHRIASLIRNVERVAVFFALPAFVRVSGRARVRVGVAGKVLIEFAFFPVALAGQRHFSASKKSKKREQARAYKASISHAEFLLLNKKFNKFYLIFLAYAKCLQLLLRVCASVLVCVFFKALHNLIRFSSIFWVAAFSSGNESGLK